MSNAERISEQVGKRIREARVAKKMSQTELGQRLVPHVSHVAISDLERGRVDIGLDRLAAVARALDMDVKPLLGWSRNYCPCCGQVIGGNALPQEITIDDLRSGGMYGFAAEPNYAETESEDISLPA